MIVGVIVAIAVSGIAVIPRTVARAVIPTVAISVPPILPVAVRISVTVAAVLDLLDIGGVDRCCFRHANWRGV